jgi:hypothetical protein
MEDRTEGEALREANQCSGLGLGVGGLGAGAAMALGATCPLCFVVAPGLVGLGLLERRSAKAAARRKTEEGLRHGR